MSVTVLTDSVPSVDVYCHLRQAAGLSPKDPQAAARGLANTLFAVQLHDGREVIGMGRVIGDGGLFYQVVDIAVLPEHQGQGHGKRIMAAIQAWLEANVPASGFVSLLADGQAQALYAQHGFVATAPASVGMRWQRHARTDAA
ncbi:GNAT family N-acetyltransferase [Luteimonas sp. e5]